MSKREEPITVIANFYDITGDWTDFGLIEEKEFDLVDEVVDYLAKNDVNAASSPCPIIGVTYQAGPEEDTAYGEKTLFVYHIRKATPEEEIEIYGKVFPNYQEECAKMIEEMMTPAERRKRKREELKRETAIKKITKKW